MKKKSKPIARAHLISNARDISLITLLLFLNFSASDYFKMLLMASDITINACTLSNIIGLYHQRDQEKLSLDSDNNFEL